MTTRTAISAAVLAVLLNGGQVRAQQPATTRALSLEDARALAVARTEDVAAARAGQRRAGAQVRAARSSFWPQLSGYGSYDRSIKSEYEGLFDAGMGMGMEGMEGIDELPFGRDNTWRLGLSLTQELWSFGRSLRRLAGARAGQRQADIAVGSAAAQAELSAAQAYYDALLADQLLQIAQVTLGQAQETLRITELGRVKGQTPEFDLLRAQVTRDNQLSVVTQRRSDRDLALVRLKQVIGLPLADAVALTTPLEDAAEVREAERLAGQRTQGSPAPADVVRALTGHDIARVQAEAGRRAPVRQAREALSAREEALGAARAERWPTLSLTSDYGIVNYPIDVFPGTDDWRTNWTVGVFLSVPLFTGFRTSADIDAAEADVDEARARLQQTRRAAAVDSLSASEQVAVARATWDQNARTVSQAQRAYQIADLRFQQGISNHLDLVDARVQLDQARVNRARAAHDLRVARIRVELLPRLPLTGAAAANQVAPANSQPAPAPSAPAQAAGTGAPRAPGAAQ
ncbi:MAG TPA: TolC family protein [Kofleriaceae bacterium]|nr:TolC family protein [Kofleriaceae bacterium]